MTESANEFPGVRLLLVDSDEARRAELKALITRAGGGTVVEAAALSASVNACAGIVPDLVVVAFAGEDDDDDDDRLRTLAADLGASAVVPVLGIVADGSPAARERAAHASLHDFALYPLSADELRMRISNVLTRGRLRRLLGDRSARLTDALRSRAAESDAVRESLSVVAAMADFHDDEGDHHAQRVGMISGAIASALGMAQDSADMLREASPLHDIGKVGISRRIVLKPGKLTPSEWLHIQHHVDIGAQILGHAQSPVLVLAAEIARTHHERYDGTGYSAGLRGDEIPISGRIVAVADVYDTLTHDRPYRPAWEADRALHQIQSESGTHFDPRVVEVFLGLEHAIFERATGEPRQAA